MEQVQYDLLSAAALALLSSTAVKLHAKSICTAAGHVLLSSGLVQQHTRTPHVSVCAGRPGNEGLWELAAARAQAEAAGCDRG